MRKIINLIEGLGADFLKYIKPLKLPEHLQMILSKMVKPKSANEIFTVVTNGINHIPISLKKSNLDENGKFDPNSLTQEYDPNKPKNVVKTDYLAIFQTCRKHPHFRKCVCAAYPFSPICKKNYCSENANSHFCNKNYCPNKRNDKKNCICLSNPKSQGCKCLIYGNFDKSCYCNRFKNSIFCEKNFCSNQAKSNHIFCTCQRNPDGDECEKDYCKKNPNDKRCKCLINPNARDCICESVSNLSECEGKLDKIRNAYNNYNFQPNN
jgi:hypothetical protein